MHKNTLVATSGCTPEKHEGVVNTPVYRASTVLFPTLDELDLVQRGDSIHSPYGRFGTRTSEELEHSIAQLEGGDFSIVTASGLSAIWLAISTFVRAGDHILVVDTVYGPVRSLCKEELKKNGVETTFFDPMLKEEVAGLIRPNTRLIYLESPGSLTFEMQDIPAIARIAHKHGLVVLSDNTWATPLHIKPFALGVDVSIQSVTKYIGGHSDLMMGAVTCKEQHYRDILKTFRNTGACASPDVCYLAQRGLHTLAARLRQHDESARAIGVWLQNRPEVAVVLHPALPGAPGHELWQRDFTGACGLFSFVLKEQPSRQKLEAMLNNMTLFGMGYSWGGFESLIIPFDPKPIRTASTWGHAGQAFRLHVGLEHVDDLREDLAKGFDRLRS